MSGELIDLDDAGVRAELAALINASERREPLLGRAIAADEVPALLADAGAFRQEGRLWRGAAAEAFGFLRFFQVDDDAINSDLRLFVDPALWRGGAADAILAWAAGRVSSVRAERGGRLWLYSDCLPDAAWRQAALERHGLRPVRSSHTMERSLREPLAGPLPAGYRLRTLRAVADLAEWVELFNLAYGGQWNSVATTVEAQADLRRDERYRERYDLVACDGAGRLAAFCLGFVLERDGAAAGWVLELGTRPASRGQGLGRALLAEALGRFREDGLPAVRLIVDSANPSGAMRLYQRLGFVSIQHEVLYGCEFAPP